MKQFLFLSLVTVGCGMGAIISPFWGVLLYYGLAALRPQELWKWALPADVRWSLLAAVIILVSVAMHLGDLFRRARVNPVFLLMLGFGLLLILSVLGARNPHAAQPWALEYAKILFIAAIASLVIERLWQVRLSAAVMMGAVAYIAYEINFMYFFNQHRLDVYHSGYGGLDNNGAGMMLSMVLPLAAHFAISAGGVWSVPRRLIAAGLGACTLHAAMLTYSRSAMLAAACGLLWQAAFHRPRWQAGVGAAALFAVILVMAGPEIRDEFLSTRNYQQDASAQSRLDSWAAGWNIAWDHPLVGAGVRNSNTLAFNYGADIQGRTIHNQYLQVAADSGIPAALVYIAILGVATYRFGTARRACIRLEANPAAKDQVTEWRDTASLCLALQTSLVIFGVNGMFLSVEVFELPWFLAVLGGVAPLALERRVRSAEVIRENEEAAEDSPTPPIAAVSGVPA